MEYSAGALESADATAMAKAPPTPPRFTPPDWAGDVSAALESLRVYAEHRIDEDWSWYARNKASRSYPSKILRFGAVVLTVLGGLVPLVIALVPERPAWGWLAPFSNVRFGQLGYLLLAWAGGLVLLDRYFGYSTGWMRYIVAMQAIEKSREAFRLDWAGLTRTLASAKAGSAEQSDVVERMIQRARAVILEVKDQSEKETQAWVLEFQTNLAQLEKELKSQMEAGKPGGIDVQVSDGNKADGAVEVELDGMLADRFTGTAGSIGYVAPGLHRVTARAHKAGRDYTASAMVNVGGGQICAVTLTLGIRP
jgi:hypothetical protein